MVILTRQLQAKNRECFLLTAGIIHNIKRDINELVKAQTPLKPCHNKSWCFDGMDDDDVVSGISSCPDRFIIVYDERMAPMLAKV